MEEQQINNENPVQGQNIAQNQYITQHFHGIENKWDAHEDNELSSIQKREWQVPTIHLSADAKFLIGVDIDRSHLALVLTDQNATPIVKLWSDSFDTSFGAETCLTRVADELHTMVGGSDVTWEQVIGIGLATPGPLDRDSWRVHSPSQTMRSASQMPGWEGTHIPDYLELKLKLKKKIPITLGNDANMGALGESRYGAGRGIANLAYIKIGTGIGAGLVIGEQLYSGSTNAAGEIGHLIVVDKKRALKCICGQIGCLETVAAEPAIVQDARKGYSLSTKNPTSYQTPTLAGRVDTVGIRDVIQAAQYGDEASKAALESAAEWIASTALGVLINVFNPSLILLDGDIVRQYHDFIEIVHKQARNASLHANWTGVQIKPCELDFPVALGTVAHVIDSITGKRQSVPFPNKKPYR